MARFKDGDRVQVKAREVQGKEVHEGRYAPHLANTTGTILKFYSSQEVAVDLDIDSLPEAVRERHAQQQSAMHEKWLGSLSEEARNRLTDEEKQFRLRYVVLLTESDLEPLKGTTSKKPAEKQTEPSPRKSTTASAPQPQAATRQRASKTPEAPARPTPEQLEQMEQAYLQQRQQTRRKK